MTHKASLPVTKVIRSKPGETTRTKPVPVPVVVPVRRRGAAAAAELNAPAAVRKSRASSCSRCAQRVRCDGARRSRSSAARPGANGPKTNTEQLQATGSGKHAAAALKSRESGVCPGRSVTAEPQNPRVSQSYKAFTVIPPNPRKRRDIQRKAEAELAALEELRLSRAMGYVSINPSSVGGCMSLEEVRLKQQQEMMLRAPRKQQQVKQQTRVLMS